MEGQTTKIRNQRAGDLLRTKKTEKKTKKQSAAQKRRRLLLGLGIFLAVIAVGIAAFSLRTGKFPFWDAEEPVLSRSIVQSNPELIPEFSGQDAVVLNDNRPSFSPKELCWQLQEFYSPLDLLGRCGVAFANLSDATRPTEERGSIGSVQPTGWHQAKYEGYVASSPPYLYNRCHLIAYALSGENANERNLITGTRYFNTAVMLPYEEQVMRYLDHSDNHVLYRVTPYFKDLELVARGVEIEAYSLEDHGRGVCFHVFVYNYQPGIEIDYRTGYSRIREE